MQVRKTLHKLNAKLPNCVFRQFLVIFYKLIEISTGTIFKYDPEMVPGFVPIVKLQYVAVLQIVENPHFVHEFATTTSLYRLNSHVLNAFLNAAFVHY